ncbi:MAG TPA: hypothetical protein VI794_01015 [Patescibacteria group bacterium]|nr:hypothetical protein [Patescibacteria group bacterium]
MKKSVLLGHGELLMDAVGDLLRSDPYEARLRRILLKDPDPKILADFLTMDNVVLVARILLGDGDAATRLTNRRSWVFTEAYRKTQIRMDAKMTKGGKKLFHYLLDHAFCPWGRTPNIVVLILREAEKSSYLG